jgi:hypothetical protein
VIFVMSQLLWLSGAATPILAQDGAKTTTEKWCPKALADEYLFSRQATLEPD